MSKKVKINYLIVRWAEESYQIVAHYGELEKTEDLGLKLVSTFDLQGLIIENFYGHALDNAWGDDHDFDCEVYDKSKKLLSETQIVKLSMAFAFENNLCFWTHRDIASIIYGKPSDDFRNEIPHTGSEVFHKAAVALGWHTMNRIE